MCISEREYIIKRIHHYAIVDWKKIKREHRQELWISNLLLSFVSGFMLHGVAAFFFKLAEVEYSGDWVYSGAVMGAVLAVILIIRSEFEFRKPTIYEAEFIYEATKNNLVSQEAK